MLQHLTQAGIYSQLRQNGSDWLKKHVIYADRQLIVLDKPPGLVCQMNHRQERTDAVSPCDILHFLQIYKYRIPGLDAVLQR